MIFEVFWIKSRNTILASFADLSFHCQLALKSPTWPIRSLSLAPEPLDEGELGLSRLSD